VNNMTSGMVTAGASRPADKLVSEHGAANPLPV